MDIEKSTRQKRGIDWDAQPLGSVTDYELTRRLSVSRGSVAYQRRKRGIEACQHARTPRMRAEEITHQKRGIDWDAQPLGSVADHELARRLGVTHVSVSYQRKKRGIEAYQRPTSKIDWDAQPLGMTTDRQLARRLGVTTATVRWQRQLRGIAPIAPRRAAIDWDAQPLGAMLDRELGEQLGVVPSTVAAARLKRGIHSYTRGTLPARIDWDAQPLGRHPDAVLARRLGVSEDTVNRARRVRGLARFRSRFVTVSPVSRVRDLEVLGATGASLMHCVADDDVARATFAQLQTHLTGLRNLWDDVDAVTREDYLKEAFEFVRDLNEHGFVVCFGTCMRPFGAGRASTKFRTLCLVAWARGEEQDRIAIEK